MKRRKAREFALRLLYQIDIRQEPPEEILRAFRRGYPHLDPELRDFAENLVTSVWTHLAEIDRAIAAATINWDLDRMSYMDRNILRMATCEMRYLTGIPPVVAINEAIEIAKVYGTEDSPRFVNGILNTIKDQTCPDGPPAGAQTAEEPTV